MQGTLLAGNGEGCPQADGEALSAFPWGYSSPVGAAPSQPWHLSTIRRTLEHVKGYYPVPVTPASHLILLPISPQADASSGVWGAPFWRHWWFCLGQRCGAPGVTALSLCSQPGAKAIPDQVQLPSPPTRKPSPASPPCSCTSLHGPWGCRRPHGEAVGPWHAGEWCWSSPSPPLSPGDAGVRQSPCWLGRPDNGPFEGHKPIWDGKSLNIMGSRMGPAFQRDTAECPNLQTAPAHGKWFAALQ